MHRRVVLKMLAALPAAALAACASAPYTDRPQFILVPRSAESRMGEDVARDILKKEKLSTDPEKTGPVERSGRRIAEVAEAPDFAWQFHTIDKPDTVNAFALPGGKVFVYTGLFKLASTEEELATVIGHEAAHVIARHGAERMSQAMALDLGARAALIAAGGAGYSAASMKAFQVAFGVAANVGVILPFSRQHEYEADRIGTILMAKAGYDPRKALAFWTKMAEHSKDKQKPPEYLSTHPSDESRIAALKDLMPEALSYYKRG
ncbi:MAG: M48 family metallopeptidase [Thermodesulfobacteriota bacterium]